MEDVRVWWYYRPTWRQSHLCVEEYLDAVVAADRAAGVRHVRVPVRHLGRCTSLGVGGISRVYKSRLIHHSITIIHNIIHNDVVRNGWAPRGSERRQRPRGDSPVRHGPVDRAAVAHRSDAVRAEVLHASEAGVSLAAQKIQVGP